ncbi:MAG TPA: hypothetical protein DCL95_02445 [Rhodospirillaceae bacterium]|nr:hypothetical protein [Rhodospirillaceae bacterium]MAX64968.1 hypothetical protein [Rhodospirillaceae bacterium]MBB57221.1 hypothetical protein [Rhodospirillaceae bacterium]HAE00088.1 hypothetical protein [Rhodospirillaceae bacterium]HAJ18915.1 hypothetical protein [Rhodospirillaceae bacterium]
MMTNRTASHPHTSRKGRVLLVACAAILIGLTGCRESEQDRIIDFDPGVYKGKEDTPLSQETLDELRRRAAIQETP